MVVGAVVNGRRRLVIVAAVLIALAIFVRNIGLYPLIFADEYTYNQLSRLLPLSSSPIPIYLYAATYRLTSMCSDGFLACVRVTNLLFLLGALPFIYAVARRFQVSPL